jgi:DUF1365 family protein
MINTHEPPQVLLGRGNTWHQRLHPCGHRFAYPLYFLMLPMRQLRQAKASGQKPDNLIRNRWSMLSFFDVDHGEGGHDALAWIENLLAQQGIQPEGEIWLQTFPRVLGYTFKPVSFWLVLNAQQQPLVILAEVNNTFGERHVYWLEGNAQEPLQWGKPCLAHKVFHVSPFCQVAGQYQFVVTWTPATPTSPGLFRAQVDLYDDQGPLVKTGIHGDLEPFTRSLANRVFFSHPLMTFGVIARIHWQAFKLWRKKVPFFSKPIPPTTKVSKSIG